MKVSHIVAIAGGLVFAGVAIAQQGQEPNRPQSKAGIKSGQQGREGQGQGPKGQLKSQAQGREGQGQGPKGQRPTGQGPAGGPQQKSAIKGEMKAGNAAKSKAGAAIK